MSKYDVQEAKLALYQMAGGQMYLYVASADYDEGNNTGSLTLSVQVGKEDYVSYFANKLCGANKYSITPLASGKICDSTDNGSSSSKGVAPSVNDLVPLITQEQLGSDAPALPAQGPSGPIKTTQAKAKAKTRAKPLSRSVQKNAKAATAKSHPRQPTKAADPQYPLTVNFPDFVLADWSQVQAWFKKVAPAARAGRRKCTNGIRWLIHWQVIAQKRSIIALPDRLTGQVVRGACKQRWPKNWRQLLQKRLLSNTSLQQLSAECPAYCPLADAAEHRHLWYNINTNVYSDVPEKLLGTLDQYAVAHDQDVMFYDWQAKPENGRIGTAVYLPLLVFGPSPLSGLSHAQQHILLALTHETTRAKQSQRDDKAMLITGGKGAQVAGANHLAICPLLHAGRSYVAFCGNGSFQKKWLRGRGYRLVGKTNGGWLHRAGYMAAQDDKSKWQQVKAFLTDLQAVVDSFGLIVGGWNGSDNRWYSLSDLLGLVKSQAGRKLLNRILLRVYTSCDYLDRWRAYFARKLGFTTIPGSKKEVSPETPQATPGGSICSAVELALWMQQNRLTNQKLAAALGTTKQWVSGQRSGRKAWSAAFAGKVNSYKATLAAQDGQVATNNSL